MHKYRESETFWCKSTETHSDMHLPCSLLDFRQIPTSHPPSFREEDSMEEESSGHRLARVSRNRFSSSHQRWQSAKAQPPVQSLNSALKYLLRFLCGPDSMLIPTDEMSDKARCCPRPESSQRQSAPLVHNRNPTLSRHFDMGGCIMV